MQFGSSCGGVAKLGPLENTGTEDRGEGEEEGGGEGEVGGGGGGVCAVVGGIQQRVYNRGVHIVVMIEMCFVLSF